MMNYKRIEYEFQIADLMRDIRKAAPDASLRDLQAISGVSPSVFSHWDHGSTPDLGLFMKVCAAFNLIPGDYFKLVVWTRGDAK